MTNNNNDIFAAMYGSAAAVIIPQASGMSYHGYGDWSIKESSSDNLIRRLNTFFDGKILFRDFSDSKFGTAFEYSFDGKTWFELPDYDK